MVLELKAKLVKIKIELKEVKKQLSVIHFSININISFQHKYHFSNLKNKNSFSLQDFKILKKEVETLLENN